ncbi:MAG TPA: hypothetical protein VMH35_24670 [Streptosporangiaceae bacterium]|nr:hypothetical protein [Streptosporangiaceae bacterium]
MGNLVIHPVIPPAALFGYATSGAVLTLALPLGLFIVVMIAVYVVSSRRRTVPGHGPAGGAKPVAPEPQAARDAAAATAFPAATSGGGTEPLADRATPPRVGALREDPAGNDDDTAVSDTAVRDTAAGGTGAGDRAASEPEAGGTEAGDRAAGEPAADGQPADPG